MYPSSSVQESLEEGPPPCLSTQSMARDISLSSTRSATVWRHGASHTSWVGYFVIARSHDIYPILIHAGAYLFEAEPPFAVTHISPEPIIPQPLYGEAAATDFRCLFFVSILRNLKSRFMTAFQMKAMAGRSRPSTT